jgi:endonuclease YncB( thermonuclease family)
MDDFFKPELKFNVPLTITVERIWIYEANVVRAVDGDTTVMNIDQGMNHWSNNQYVRYAGINAPEAKGTTKVAGDAATAYLNTLIDLTDTLYLATIGYHEFEKYGRVLAVVFTAPPSSIPWAGATLADILPGSVNQEMLDSENAVPYDPDNL